MLSLSKKTDYALLALSYLAGVDRERAANTREIADHYTIPAELLAKILQRLAKARLVISTAGPTGGYRLARSASEISVATIVEAIDGPPAITQCMKLSDNACEQSNRCTIRQPLARINARILQMLSLISLAEIASDDSQETVYPIFRHAPSATTIPLTRANASAGEHVT
jgi:Rrf2 family protein